MPLYEYVCTACAHEFEEMQKFSDAPVRKCPKCGKNKVEKKISLSGFALKGSGWYKDGYAKPGETSGAKDKSDKPEKKPEAKSETGKTDAAPKTKNCATGGCAAA